MGGRFIDWQSQDQHARYLLPARGRRAVLGVHPRPPQAPSRSAAPAAAPTRRSGRRPPPEGVATPRSGGRPGPGPGPVVPGLCPMSPPKHPPEGFGHQEVASASPEETLFCVAFFYIAAHPLFLGQHWLFIVRGSQRLVWWGIVEKKKQL